MQITRAASCQRLFPQAEPCLRIGAKGLNICRCQGRSCKGSEHISEDPSHNNRITDSHGQCTDHRYPASVSPSLRLHLVSQAMPKASMGPERVPRPKLISPITPVKPISATKIKYGIRNDPPPYRETLVGNIQIFPIPTADPMQARMNPQRLLKDSRFFIKIKFPLSVDRFSIT